MLLLAAVAVMIVGVIFGFDMSEEHTANCGVPRPLRIAGIQHEASGPLPCTGYLLGAILDTPCGLRDINLAPT